MIHSVILCGGAGERLWPLSRKSCPKQFLNFVHTQSLFQRAATCLSSESCNPIVITNEDYRFIVRQQLHEVEVSSADVIIEPQRKNTAPAILAAAMHVVSKDPSGLMVVLPSDHLIPDQEAFKNLVLNAEKNMDDHKIVCLGVHPSRAETGYGYIRVGDANKNIYRVEEFVEKPSLEVAQKFLESERYFWNAGVFIVKAKYLLELAEKLQQEMLIGARAAYEKSKLDLDFIRLDPASWQKIKGDSFDYAFMEKAGEIGCMLFEGDWSDLGDWNALAREFNQTNSNNTIIGNAFEIDSKNSILWSENEGQILAGIGLQNIIAVSTSDAVLVAPKSKSQEIKSIVRLLTDNGQKQAQHHLFEFRPWGTFEEIATSDYFRINKLNILPGANISLQCHENRSEHWAVVRGTATIVNGEKKYNVSTSESTYVEAGTKHMLQNNTKEDLMIIEIQIGYNLTKDDIARFDCHSD